MKYLKTYKIFESSNIDCESGAYAVMTKELEDKLHYDRMKDGYLFRYKSLEELEELKNEYPVGGSYNGEEIIDVSIFPEEK